ncbi:hypothetical protein Q5P01_004669 [Channa striata]|uniref:Uncharacterized protein n=1 Tax=Channa striata TaxID=64152 RepID=A0AA88NC93_CHASR|nr:hypothetical protein Q5P01_004669 [Channa striata]
MSAEIPMDKTCQSPSTDSVPAPASVLPASGVSGLEQPGGDRLGPSAFQGEPVLAKTQRDETTSTGRSQPTAASTYVDASQAINQTVQQAPDHLHEVVHQQFEQIHQVLQEHSRLLALLGKGLVFPPCLPSGWIGLLPVLPATNSEKPRLSSSSSLAPQLPVSPASSPPSAQRRPEVHLVPESADQGKNQFLPPETTSTSQLLTLRQNK